MKIACDTPDLLVLQFTRWKGPLFFAVLSLFWLGAAAALVAVATVPFWMLLAWLCATVAFSVPTAVLRAEKSMLVLNAATGEAELRRRDVFGLHRHYWPLDEVQSTRVTRHRRNGPADQDPHRILTLYVKHGMDEGLHSFTKYPIPSADALAASARVSEWMQAWRKRCALDSAAPPP